MNIFFIERKKSSDESIFRIEFNEVKIFIGSVNPDKINKVDKQQYNIGEYHRKCSNENSVNDESYTTKTIDPSEFNIVIYH